MKKCAFLIVLVAMVLTSCNSMERKEKNFIKEMQGEDLEKAANAFNGFCEWLVNDSATMSHDFAMMREQYRMKAISSPDHLVRCYSWTTNGDAKDPSYANVVTWKVGDNYIGYKGPIDAFLAGRTANIKKQSTLAHSIDTVFEIDATQPRVYLIAQSYVNDKGFRRAYVSATTIEGIQLTLLPFFFDGIEIAGNYEFTDNAGIPIGDLFKWDEKAQKFYAYQTNDSNKVIPGKYVVYQLGKNRFERLPEE